MRLNIIIVVIFIASACTQDDFGFSLSPIDLLKSFIEVNLDKIKEVEARGHYGDHNSFECYNGFVNLMNGIENREMWAIRVLDSYSKVSSGYLQGNIVNLGNFDECLAVDEWNGTELVFKGQYCLTPLKLKFADGMLVAANMSSELKSLIKLFVATCIPSTCSQTLYQDIIFELFGDYIIYEDTMGVYSGCHKRTTEYKFSNLDVFAIVFVAGTAALMILSTLYEMCVKGGPNKLLTSFSIITHGKLIFRLTKIKHEYTISCLDGIRVLAIFSVLLSHSYIIAGLAAPTLNKIEILNVSSDLDIAALFMLIFHSTHLFLFLSGFLLGWTIFRISEKTKSFDFIPKMYILRYIRVTPAYAVTILLMITLVKFVADGPFARTIIEVAEVCQRSWWSQLLYIQTITNLLDQCPPGSWYLSVDFQLFAISPLILIPLLKYGRKALILPIGLYIAATLNTWLVLANRNFNYQKIFSSKENYVYMQTIHLTAQHRCEPWLVGIILSKIMYDQRNKKVNLRTYNLDVLGWTLSLLFAIYVFSRTRLLLEPLNLTFTPFNSRLHHICFHNLLIITVAWCVYACFNGSGGVVNKVLSWPIWTPIARLSYAAFLVHIFVLIRVASSARAIYTFDRLLVALGIIILSFLAAVPFRIAFEASYNAITEVVFMKIFPQKPKTRDVEIETGDKL